MEHWYRINEVLLETNGYEAVSMEQVRQQLADALHNPSIPAAFASDVRRHARMTVNTSRNWTDRRQNA